MTLSQTDKWKPGRDFSIRVALLSFLQKEIRESVLVNNNLCSDISYLSCSHVMTLCNTRKMSNTIECVHLHPFFQYLF